MMYLVLIIKDIFVYVVFVFVGVNLSLNFLLIKKFKCLDWIGRKNIEYFGFYWDSKKNFLSFLYFFFN